MSRFLKMDDSSSTIEFNMQITQEARDLLAAAYDEKSKRKQPEANMMIANEVRKGWSKQFDVELLVITKLLEPKKYCRYDLPTAEDINDDCNCHWCSSPYPNQAHYLRSNN